MHFKSDFKSCLLKLLNRISNFFLGHYTIMFQLQHNCQAFWLIKQFSNLKENISFKLLILRRLFCQENEKQNQQPLYYL